MRDRTAEQEAVSERRVARCVLDDGTPHGPFVHWMNGRMIRAGHLVHGEPHGSLVEWSEPSGRLATVAHFEHGIEKHYRSWNEVGVKTAESTELTPGRFELHTFYDSGVMKSKSIWSDDHLHELTYWYESGRISLEGQFNSEGRTGAWTCWADAPGDSYTVGFDDRGRCTSFTTHLEDAPGWAERCLQGCTLAPAAPAPEVEAD